MIREYFAIHFPDFLTRISDKQLFKSMVESLGGDMGLGDEVDPSRVHLQADNRKAENNHQTQSYGNIEHGTRDLLSGESAYSADEINQYF